MCTQNALCGQNCTVNTDCDVNTCPKCTGGRCTVFEMFEKL
jgi:hypothetical protein